MSRFSVMQAATDKYVVTDMATGKFVGITLKDLSLRAAAFLINSNCETIADVKNIEHKHNIKH